jgi:hypothetical protein
MATPAISDAEMREKMERRVARAEWREQIERRVAFLEAKLAERERQVPAPDKPRQTNRERKLAEMAQRVGWSQPPTNHERRMAELERRIKDQDATIGVLRDDHKVRKRRQKEEDDWNDRDFDQQCA